MCCCPVCVPEDPGALGPLTLDEEPKEIKRSLRRHFKFR